MTATTTGQATARTDERLSRALVWSYLYTTGGSVVAALLQIGITAVLDPRSFGVMVLAMVWVSLALTLQQHGPTLAIIQQDNVTDAHADAAFWVTVAGTTLYTAVFAATAPLWAVANHLPELTVVCWALTPVILLAGSNAILEAVIRRRMQMRSIALRGLSAGIISGLAGLGCAIAGLGVWALVVQQLVVYGLNTVLLWIVTPWRPSLRPRLRGLRDLGSTSVHTLSGAIGYFVTSRIDAILMGIFFAPSAVGLYRFAARFAEMVIDLTSRGVQQVSLPELARYSTDRGKLGDRLARIMHIGAVASFPPLGVLAAVAAPFVSFIGTQWTPAATPLQLLCLVSGIGVVSNLLAPALQAASRPAIPAAFTWLSAALFVGGFLAAVRLSTSAGTIGRLTAVALAILSLRIVLTSVMAYTAYRIVLRVPIRPTVVAVVPAVFASLAAFGLGRATVDVMALLARPRPLPTLLVSGAAAVCAACVVLLWFDRDVRAQGGRALRRLRAIAPTGVR